MRNSGRPWKPEEEAALRRMIAKGCSRKYVGLALGRSTAAVSRRMERLGLSSRKSVPAKVWHRWLSEPHSGVEVARRAGVTVQAVYRAKCRLRAAGSPVYCGRRQEGGAAAQEGGGT